MYQRSELDVVFAEADGHVGAVRRGGGVCEEEPSLTGGRELGQTDQAGLAGGLDQGVVRRGLAPGEPGIAAQGRDAAAGEFGFRAAAAPMVAAVDEEPAVAEFGELAFVGVRPDRAAELPSAAVVVAIDDVRGARAGAVGRGAMIGGNN